MKRFVPALAAAFLVSALSGCVSLDLLSEFRFEGRTLSSRMLTPPEPDVFASYDMRIDRDDPVGSVLRVGTGIAMAAQVHETRQKLTRVLEAVNIPEEIRVTALDTFADVLGCEVEEGTDRGEVVLYLEIREYGIDAGSWGGASEFTVSLRATLRDAVDGREIWRARVEESTPISPAVFGLGGAVGNVVTAVTLSELSDEEIGRGMMVLAQRVATRAADRLERDLMRAGVY